jgi:hypothetical protein
MVGVLVVLRVPQFEKPSCTAIRNAKDSVLRDRMEEKSTVLFLQTTKRPVRETVYRTQSSFKVKTAWNYAFHSATRLHVAVHN